MLTIIHNVYLRNPFVRDSVLLNLMSLKQSKIPYQYILFNDHGDSEIEDDIKEFIDGDGFEYIYSNKNYGFQMCSGGWVGAIPYIKGKYINNIGQDDVFTSMFYRNSYQYLESSSDVYLTFANCFNVKEDLTINGLGMNLQTPFDYNNPLQAFMDWFGVDCNKVTRANNNMMAPGTVYRTSLHELIGIPDVETFRGVCDFEYWARILFNKYKCHYLPEPTWLYRRSEYTAGNAMIDGKPNREYWHKHYVEKVKQKYSILWDNLER